MKKKTYVTLAKILRHKPCEDRIQNYIKHYGKKRFTPKQFLALEHITQSDKLWVAFRLMPKRNVRLVAADIAESVLHIFEAQYSTDMRPRNAIKAARRGRGSDADWAAGAVWAAWAGGVTWATTRAAWAIEAAAGTDWVAKAAAYAARAARATWAAETIWFTVWATANIGDNKLAQDALNLKIILKYWK